MLQISTILWQQEEELRVRTESLHVPSPCCRRLSLISHSSSPRRWEKSFISSQFTGIIHLGMRQFVKVYCTSPDHSDFSWMLWIHLFQSVHSSYCKRLSPLDFECIKISFSWRAFWLLYWDLILYCFISHFLLWEKVGYKDPTKLEKYLKQVT